jgi:rod shape determining protein RodA
MLKRNSFFKNDIFLMLIAFSLTIIGIIFIYSSNINKSDTMFHHQLIWALTGILILIGFYLINYKFLKNYIIYIYMIPILLIILVIIISVIANRTGSNKSWFKIGSLGIQPSEFAKISTIFMLGAFFENRKKDIQNIKTFSLGFLIVLIPMLLILAQGDLGTALVYFPVFLFMAYIAGAKPQYVLFVLFTGILLVIFTVLPEVEKHILEKDVKFFDIYTDTTYFFIFTGFITVSLLISIWGYYSTKKRLFYVIIFVLSVLLFSMSAAKIVRATGVLDEYQMKRLYIFLDPTKDSQGYGFNTLNAMKALQAGGGTGTGLTNGAWSQNNYIPEQSTDFIFSIIGEEWGFIGSLSIVILYFIFFIFIFIVMKNSEDFYAKIVIAGIAGMFFTHFVINIGMVIGIMPVTGIPLFFLSYGGSSLWTAMAATGIVMNINSRKLDIIN